MERTILKRFFIIIVLPFILVTCGETISEEELIGGEWVASAGYEDGEVSGEENCFPFEKGNQFKSEDTVYNTSFD